MKIRQNNIKRVLKTALSNAERVIDDRLKYQLTLSNPQAPQPYSLNNLHKPGNPIRPVVSYVTASATRLSRFLIEEIKNHCKIRPKYSIKNSYELFQNIRMYHIMLK